MFPSWRTPKLLNMARLHAMHELLLPVNQQNMTHAPKAARKGMASSLNAHNRIFFQHPPIQLESGPLARLTARQNFTGGLLQRSLPRGHSHAYKGNFDNPLLVTTQWPLRQLMFTGSHARSDVLEHIPWLSVFALQSSEDHHQHTCSQHSSSDLVALYIR